MATASWFVEVVQVTSPGKQQEVLALLHGITGLTALGTTSGRDHFVVFECADHSMKISAEVLIAEIDRHVIWTYPSGPGPRRHLSPIRGGVA